MTCPAGCGSLQDKVCKGYGKAGQKAGQPFTLYRPSAADSVIDEANIVEVDLVPQTAFYALLSVDGKFTKPNKYGNALWQSFHDCTVSRVGDYLQREGATYFVAAQQSMLPPLVVECNATIDIIRPVHPGQGDVGAVGYGGQVSSNDEALMTGWPASVLMDRSDNNDVRLPLDVKRPGWKILLPVWPGTVLRTSDQITDDLGRRYAVSTAELTDFGWRLTAVQLEA